VVRLILFHESILLLPLFLFVIENFIKSSYSIYIDLSALFSLFSVNYNKMNSLRIDFIFSYWILVWYALYITRIIPYSPKFLFIIGILENLVSLFFIFYGGSSLSTILKFILVNVIIKGIPFYTIRNDIIYKRDMLLSFLLFILYCIWLYINHENMFEIYQKIRYSLIHNKDDLPGIRIINFFFSGYNSLIKK
jgi:hypothetical protein